MVAGVAVGHSRETMTPKERRNAFAENRPYDRIPHGFALGDAASRVIGSNMAEFHCDPEKQLKATLTAYKTYGLDSVGTTIPIQELVGATVIYPPYSTPYIRDTLELSEADIDALGIDDPKSHPKMKRFWQVLDGLLEAVGAEAPVSVSVGGPFSVAGRVIGTEKLMRKLLKEPEYVLKLVGKITEVQISVVNSLEGYGVSSFGITDPVASGTLISPEQYRKFAKPYEKKLFNAMTRVAGRKPQCHICGDTNRILRDMVETGAGSISVDNMMDLDYVVSQVGTDAVVTGNVNPTETMLSGTSKDVREDLRNCLKKGSRALGGYTPSFGCGLPLNTPHENLVALFDALWEFGKYPFNPENL
ncbi:MAG: uroporphyrinogen decarboxylase family protein [Synergistaceae bacterium]|jgi:uroporphyrinogen decarboxylase|nr:uroporphyrinogen decarboxylase family protein [Synergistaceae bacterium]